MIKTGWKRMKFMAQKRAWISSVLNVLAFCLATEDISNRCTSMNQKIVWNMLIWVVLKLFQWKLAAKNRDIGIFCVLYHNILVRHLPCTIKMPLFRYLESCHLAEVRYNWASDETPKCEAIMNLLNLLKSLKALRSTYNWIIYEYSGVWLTSYPIQSYGISCAMR